MDLKREETAGEKQGGKALLFMDEFLSQADVIIPAELCFSEFRTRWKSSPCRFIHLFRFKKNEDTKFHLRRSSESAFILPVFEFLLAQLRLPAVSPSRSAWSIYSLYALQATQISEDCLPIPLRLVDWDPLLHWRRFFASPELAGSLVVPILDKMVADGSLQFVLDSISDEEIGNLHARPLEQLEPFLRRNAASVFPRPVAAEADLETLASLRREYLEAQRALDGDFGVTEQEDDAEMKALLEAVEAFDEQAERLHCLSRDPELLKVALKEPWLPRDAPRVIESVRGREQARKKEEALPLESGGPVIRLGRTMVEEEVEEEEILEDKDKEIEEVKRGQRGRKTGGVKRKGGRSAVSKPKSSKRKTASASGQDAASEIPEEENKLSSKIKSILTMLQD